MKKIVLALLTILSTHVEGQNLDNSLLWKISGNGLKEASYLFGTIHITCDDKLPPKAIKAMEETKQLYLELDMDDPALQQSMMGGMMMKNGTTLTSLSSESDFKIVDDFLKKELGFSAQMFNTIKPFMISAMLYPKMINCEMKSVEGSLMMLSGQQKKKVFGLETVQEQLSVFDAIPYDIQMKELIKTAKSNLDNDKAEMDSMLKIYKSEDINAMVALMKESENEITSRFEGPLLTDRNKKWIPKIETVARETPTFFGVGAGHLGGENGVIILLKKAGFTVEPVF